MSTWFVYNSLKSNRKREYNMNQEILNSNVSIEEENL